MELADMDDEVPLPTTAPPVLPAKMKIPYHHKHSLHYRPPIAKGPVELGIVQQDLLDKLLIESIKSICQEQAYKQGIPEPYIDSVTLEALRSSADEFIYNLCRKVQRSMHAARRNVPIAPDVDEAFYALDIPVPSDQLKPYATRPQVNRALPTPPPEEEQDEFHRPSGLPEHVLGSELSRQQDLKKFSFNPRTLPPVPSAHTYRDTQVYLQREADTKRIRELATEEGKLGEQALRKLAGAMKMDSALLTEPEMRFIKDRRPLRLRKPPVPTEEAMFEETMRSILSSAEKDFEMGPMVSSEKQYRMPDEGRVKRRQLNTAPPPKASTGSSGVGKYNLIPPPKLKIKSSVTAENDLSFEL